MLQRILPSCTPHITGRSNRSLTLRSATEKTEGSYRLRVVLNEIMFTSDEILKAIWPAKLRKQCILILVLVYTLKK